MQLTPLTTRWRLEATGGEAPPTGDTLESRPLELGNQAQLLRNQMLSGFVGNTNRPLLHLATEKTNTAYQGL